MNDGKHIFVFGSNLAGRHGKGAALQAKNHWGALNGIGHGRGGCGYSYAIPTKDTSLVARPLCEISEDVYEFDAYATWHRELTFLVTPIGTGLAGYSHKQIAPMFKDVPDNCVLPKEWERILKDTPK